MKKIVLMLALMAFTLPVLAQGRSVDLTGFMAWVDLSGDGVIERDGDDYSLGSFDADTGYGGALNIFLTRRLSAEISLTEVKPEGRIQFGATTVVGELDMLPITGMLQYHFNPEGRVDVWVSGGVAYLMFDEFHSDDLGSIDVESVDLEDDYGSVWGAGLSIGIAGGLAIVADAKYVLSSNTITTTVGDAEIELNPLMVTAGLQIQF
ncbi:MAG: outer membrane beta-barrel protein [Acidobacteria bacterium]|nr:outer membrane beta-barrel protein [Acidobacteriota bacterium]